MAKTTALYNIIEWEYDMETNDYSRKVCLKEIPQSMAEDLQKKYARHSFNQFTIEPAQEKSFSKQKRKPIPVPTVLQLLL